MHVRVVDNSSVAVNSRKCLSFSRRRVGCRIPLLGGCGFFVEYVRALVGLRCGVRI